MRSVCFLLAIAASAGAQVAEPPSHQKLIPTLWVQTSQEWGALCRQTYRLALRALDEALRDEHWSAIAGHGHVHAALPPAVILDIDETVLDNSPGQARQVRAGAAFDVKLWDEWVGEANADPIPGAVDFCRSAAARGVTVFYVSNREAYHEAATRSNLTRHGFPLEAAEDVVLLRGEQAGWGGDKSSRRAHVAARYRVLLLVGDDLSDFLEGVRARLARREALAAPYSEYWGLKWFLLPNPSYGSWEEALYADPKPADPGEQLKQKLGHLKTGR